MLTDMSAEDVERYRRAWHSYVARRNLLVTLFVSFLFVGFLVARLKLGEFADLTILIGWIVVYLVGAWWLTLWTCPRCGRRFSDRLWTPRCSSCNLSKEEIASMSHGGSHAARSA
jgi:hypothetical protein